MKALEISQVVYYANWATVLILSITLLWVMANIVRYFAAGNYYDKDRGGTAIKNGLITMYAVLFIWGIFTLVIGRFL